MVVMAVENKNSRATHHGYSIIEVGIVVVVLGLVLGGALVPLQARYQQSEIAKAEAYLQEAKTAVMGYALQNETLQRSVEWDDGAYIIVPAGRPYLPCPDVVGDDGLEDRRTVLVASLLTVNTTQRGYAGKCLTNKGMLPWKTLGVERYDPWGTHLTYRVDPSYSDDLYGFDETFSPDISNRGRAVTLHANTFDMKKRGSMHNAGAVICTGIVRDSGSELQCPNRQQTNLVAGVVTTTNVTLPLRIIDGYQDGGNHRAMRGIVDGMVFVIVSHGRNRYGGVGQQPDDGSFARCNAMPVNTADGAPITELVNAHYRYHLHPFHDPQARGCPDDTNIPDFIFENAFIQDPISEVEGASDDLLVWAGANELIGFLLLGGGLPIPGPLPHLDY